MNCEMQSLSKTTTTEHTEGKSASSGEGSPRQRMQWEGGWQEPDVTTAAGETSTVNTAGAPASVLTSSSCRCFVMNT